MVVARKTPAAPLPTSRTTSSQPIHRAQKSKTPLLTANGNELNTIHHPSPQPQHCPSRPRRSLLDRLFLPSLLLFLTYALVVCSSPAQHHPDPLVCRTLASYRTNLLEPYLLPPLRTALSHPAVTGPYNTHLAPHVARAAPYAKKAAQSARVSAARARPHVLAASARISKVGNNVWEGLLRPYYSRIIQPQYQKLIHPFLVKALTPLKPYVAYSQAYLHKYYTATAPRIRNSYALLHPRVVKLYNTSRPFLLAALQKTEIVLRKVLAYLRVLVVRLGTELGILRRAYVDPHVRRIWDKVAESTTESSPFSTVPATTDVFSTAESIPSPSPASLETSSHPMPAVPITPTSVHEADTEEGVTPESTPTPEPVTTSTGIPEQSAASIAEASAGAASSVIAHLEEEIKESIASLASEEEVTPPPQPVVEPAPTPEAQPGEEEDDLDDFLRDIGLTQSAQSSSDETPQQEQKQQQQPPPPQDLTPEQRAAETAAKRLEITARHQDWQNKLDNVIRDLRTRIRKNIGDVRTLAVAEIQNPTSEVRRMVGEVQGEGEKLLRGGEVYLKKMEGRKNNWNVVQEEERWKRVLEKVEQKFAGKVEEARETVMRWLQGVRDREIGEVIKVSAEAKSFAEQAQADLGLDYAWLDDVTYHDWQRYHDLSRTSESFESLARAIQNGTSPLSPSDPIHSALDELEQEMGEILNGFAIRVKALEEGGRKVFDMAGADAPSSVLDEEEEASGEEAPGKTGPLAGGQEPVYSILPVDSEDEEGQFDFSQVVMQKSPEEVESAIRRAEGEL